MTKLFKYFRKQDWFFMICNIALIVLQVYFELELIESMGKIIGLISANGSEIAPNVVFVLTRKMLIDVGVEMIKYSLIIIVCNVLENWLCSIISGTFAKTLRSSIYGKVISFSNEEINKFSTASLITRSTNDVKQVEQSILLILRLALFAPIMAGFAISKIVNSNINLSMATLGAVVAMFVLIIFLFAVAVPKFTTIQKKTDKINSVTRENLTGLRVVRAYAAENEQEQAFESVNEDLSKTNWFIAKAMSALMPGMMLIMNGLNLAIYWLGAHIFNSGSVNYATISVFTQYSIQIIFSFMMLCMLFIQIPRGFVSGKRINEVLSTKNKIVSGTNKKEEENNKIVFNNVSFRYHDADENVLQDVSFEVEKGQTVAFIGSTGSGKSTLINLVSRFYDATEGEINIFGRDIKDYKTETLNSLIGFVPQKGFLFSGTIKSNLQVANKNATQEDMENALKIAEASFVLDLEGGLNYKITEGGTNVSGGQRQRLCIARAVVKNPEIYIFDDSFSALDYKTDKTLRASLKKTTTNSVVFIVAQRVGTIMDADKIVVLDDGKVAGIGTHNQLLKNCEVYKDIAISQLGKEGIDESK